jgi:hypothetical protein
VFARARHAAADSYRQAARHRRHLHKKAALAHPGAPLHQNNRTGTGKNLLQVLAQDRNLGVLAPDALDSSTLRRSDHLWCH